MHDNLDEFRIQYFDDKVQVDEVCKDLNKIR